MPSWDPQQYGRFSDHRLPAIPISLGDLSRTPVQYNSPPHRVGSLLEVFHTRISFPIHKRTLQIVFKASCS